MSPAPFEETFVPYRGRTQSRACDPYPITNRARGAISSAGAATSLKETE